MRQCSPEEAEAVRYIVSYGGSAIPISYIQNSVFPDYPNQKVSVILRRLVDKGYLVRIEKDRAACFQPVDAPTVESYEVVAWNQKAVDKPCPPMPNIKNALKLP